MVDPTDAPAAPDGLDALEGLWDARRAKPEVGKPQGQAILALTDMGNAERLVHRHGHDLRYCQALGKWLVWNCKRWLIDLGAEIFQRAKDTTRAIPEEAHGAAGSAYAEILEHAIGTESAARQQAMVKLAANERSVQVQVAELDADPFLLNVENGTVDLRMGKLLPHAREHLCTKLAPVSFDPEATAPRFAEFLLQIMDGRQHLVDFVQRYCGYACTGDVREQVLLFLHGDGSNGKSTLLNVLIGVLGDYAHQAVPDLLMAKAQESHPTEVAELVGRRTVICTEVGEGKTMDEVRVKQLTGGDVMKGRYMRQDFFSFVPTHKIFLASNPKPNIRGADHAIWRRILLLPFDVRFSDGQKDPLLGDKLKAESSGILNWLVQGCLKWQAMGLQPPDVVREATAQYRSEEDLLAPFFEERCVFGASVSAPAGELYNCYVEWAQQSRLKAVLTQKKFGSRLRLKGLDQGRETQGIHTGRTLWKGIGLRSRSFSAEPSTPPKQPQNGPFECRDRAASGCPAEPSERVNPPDLHTRLNHRSDLPLEPISLAHGASTQNTVQMVQPSPDGSAGEPVVEEF
jgi:putative DNA primase/helicase